MKKRLLTLPKDHSFFLFGARGTGKSTLIKHFYPKKQSWYIDLLDLHQESKYLNDPQLLKAEVLALSNEIKWVVIDEVQKIPALLNVVHALIEENKQRQFILTGSSARKLKREGVDLLGGRALLKHMHPFMAAELGKHFLLTEALQLGMLPLVHGSEHPQEDLKAYLALYMKEEVQLEGLVRNLEEFSQFLEVISFSQGSVLSYANIARECSISGKTVENYVSILEDLLLAFKLPIFSHKAKRNLIAKSKFYYFDAGVYRAIRPKGPLDAPEEMHGIALETLVAQHLRAWLDYSEQEGRLYFWQTKSGLEVDFIVYGEIGFYALEVKNSSQVRSNDCRGLLEFKKDYPQAKLFLLYRGKELLKKGDILCYPAEEFLLQLKINQFPGD